MDWKNVLDTFPFISQLSNEEQELLKNNVHYREAQEGDFLLMRGERCDEIPLVISGVIRVFKISENGREMTLFRAYKGDTCLINIACQFSNDLPAEAVAQEPCELVLIPGRLYGAVLANSNAWKDFLIQMLYKRLSETFHVLEQVTFTRADKRLAQVLFNMCNGKNKTISVTHEQLSVELGTAREVVSRLLSELKQKKIVSLSRGKVTIINVKMLEEMTEL